MCWNNLRIQWFWQTICWEAAKIIAPAITPLDITLEVQWWPRPLQFNDSLCFKKSEGHLRMVQAGLASQRGNLWKQDERRTCIHTELMKYKSQKIAYNQNKSLSIRFQHMHPESDSEHPTICIFKFKFRFGNTEQFHILIYSRKKNTAHFCGQRNNLLHFSAFCWNIYHMFAGGWKNWGFLTCIHP